jgi:hypothetical protein
LNFFYARCRPPNPRLAPYTPEVETPAPAHPDRLHSTGSRAGRARCKADHATHRHTRSDAGRAAPVCTRYQTGRAGQIVTVRDAGGRGVCTKLSRFVHTATAKNYISFLNTFVACATENPFTLSQKCDIIMSQE